MDFGPGILVAALVDLEVTLKLIQVIFGFTLDRLEVIFWDYFGADSDIL